MDKLQALHSFWASFGWPAYDENSVPAGVEVPYITHESSADDFGYPVAMTASLWARATSWIAITAKEKEIAARISRGGVIILYDGGAFIIRRGSPWAQRMSEGGGNDIRRVVLNIEVEFLD